MAQQNDVNLRLVIQTAKGNAEAEITSLIRALGQASQATEQAGNKAKEASVGFHSIAEVITAVSASFLAVTQALEIFGSEFRKVTDYIQNGIHAWSEAALSAKQLQVAWEGSKRSVPLSEIEAVHAELIKLPNATHIAIEETTKLFSGLEQIPDEMMPRMLKLTADVAAFTGRDFETAGLMLSRVAQGNFEAMGRIGLRVSETAKASGNLSTVIGEIEKRVGGMGAAALGTWEGKTQDIAKQWNLINRTIGQIIGSSLLDSLERIRAKTEEWATWLKEAERAGKFDGLKTIIGELGNSFVTIRNKVFDAFSGIGTAIAEAFAGKGTNAAEFFAGALRDITGVIVKIINFLENIGENKFVIYAVAAAAAWKGFSLIVTLAFSVWRSAGSAIASVYAKVQAAQATILDLIQAQTNALNVQRTATTALAAADRKRLENFYNLPMNQPIGSNAGPVVAPGGIGKGMGGVLASSAMVGATALAFGASGESAAEMTAVTAGLQLISLHMEKLTDIAKTLGLRMLGWLGVAANGLSALAGYSSFAAVLTTITVKAGTLGTILTGLGLSAAGVAAAVAGIIAAGAYGWYTVIKNWGDLKEAWNSSAKDSIADTKRMKQEYQDLGATGEKAVKLTDKDLEGKNIKELSAMRKKAQVEYGNAIADEAKAIQDSDNKAKVKAETLKKGYREQLDAITKYANKLSEVKQAEEAKPLIAGNVFAEAALGLGKIEERIKIQNDLYDTLNKQADLYWTTLKELDTISLDNIKNEITSTTQSEQLAITQIASAETEFAAKRIQNTRAQFDEAAGRRDQLRAAQLTDVENQMKDLQVGTEAYRKFDVQKRDLIKRFSDESIAAEKQLQATLIGEIQKQSDAVRQATEKRKKLEQDVRDEMLESQKAQREVAQKSMDDLYRLSTSYAAATENLKLANSLLATMPEKAIELAKKARDEFKGLSIDVNALSQDLFKTFRDNTELLREFSKKGMSPVQAWQSDAEHVTKMIRDAQAMMSEGKFKEAAELASQAKRPAAELANAPEGMLLSQAQGMAGQLLTSAINVEEAAKKGGLEFAQNFNKEVAGQMDQAGKVIKEAQGTLMDQNTKALNDHGKLLEQLIAVYGGSVNKAKEAEAQGKEEAFDVAKYGDIANYGASVGVAAATSAAATTSGGAGGGAGLQTFAGKGGEYAPMTGGTPGYDLFTGNYVGGMFAPDSYINQLLAQSDATIKKAQADSADMKRLESLTKNIDHYLAAGLAIETPEGFSGSKQFLNMLMESSGISARLSGGGPMVDYQEAAATVAKNITDAGEKFYKDVSEGVKVQITLQDNRAAELNIIRPGD